MTLRQKRLNFKTCLVIGGIFLFFQSQPSFAIEFVESLMESQTVNPYSYNPVNEKKPDSRPEHMKKPLLGVAPESPMLITDRDGNKLVYEDGNLRVKFDEQGNSIYYSERQPRLERDYKGNLTKKYEYEGAYAKILNEWGELIGSQAFGEGGLLLKEFDEENNLTRTYLRNEDKQVEWVEDNLSGSKTKYNLDGPEYEMDFEGNINAYYLTGDRRIQKKTEKTVNEKGEIVDGNRTIYDEQGHALYVLDNEANTILTYNYGSFYRLESTVDQYGFVTEYETDRPQFLKHHDGGVFKAWNWQGTKLLSTEDKVNNSILGLEGGLVTYFKNNKPTEARFADPNHNDLLNKWIYVNGRLSAEWQATRDGIEPNRLVLYDHGRTAVALLWAGSTKKEDLVAWVKNKKLLWLDGQVRGLWDSSTKELAVLSRYGGISKLLIKEELPTQEELSYLILN